MANKEKLEPSLEERWKIVQRYYSAYKDPITDAYIKFSKMPTPHQINFLFNSMRKLVDDEIRHLETMREQMKFD